MLNTKEMCEALGGIHQSTLSGYIKEGIAPKPAKRRIKDKDSHYKENVFDDGDVEKIKANLSKRKKTISAKKTPKEYAPQKETVDLINSVFR